MRRAWIGFGLGLAWLAAPACAATVDASVQSVRTQIMVNPSDRLWAGALPVQGCGPRAIAPIGDLLPASPVRLAAWERRGELIAELRSSQVLSLSTLAAARTCATRAADATPALLTAAVETWSAFHGALASCLRSEGAAQGVGSMTLWVDTSCNW